MDLENRCGCWVRWLRATSYVVAENSGRIDFCLILVASIVGANNAGTNGSDRVSDDSKLE